MNRLLIFNGQVDFIKIIRRPKLQINIKEAFRKINLIILLFKRNKVCWGILSECKNSVKSVGD
jgi:hypothetical protein